MLKLRFRNKEHGDVWLVEPGITLGSNAACQVVLKNDGVADRHVEITVAPGDQLTLLNLTADKALKINGIAVDRQSPLQAGDEIALLGMELLVVDPKTEAKPMAAVPAASGWAIRANHTALSNKVYSINGDTVLGRSNDCDLSFSVTHLSRRHAQLSLVNGNLMVKDLDSANGTFVNGQRVKEAKLQRGDELRLDTLSFTVIGPGGDADKTTVRAAVQPVVAPVAASAAAAPKKDAAADHDKAEREKRVAGVSAFHKAVSASEAAQEAAAKPKVNWLLVGGGLLLLVAVAVFLLVR